VNKKNRYIIGIAGGSGSGKTTLIKSLTVRFQPNQVALVSQDNYYKATELQPVDMNGKYNFDLPESLDRKHFFDDMVALSNGSTITKKEYTYNNSSSVSVDVVIEPAPVIIMEGLFIFHYHEICNELDYKVFIEADHATRLARRIKRDGSYRNIEEEMVRYQWQHHVRPSEEKFLEPYRDQCHLVIDNTHSLQSGLDALIELIEEQLVLMNN
jgi:uridine kinase